VGVSAGTVSRVLNNRSRVKAGTRDRVLRAAKTLNLSPRASARLPQVAILSDPTSSDRIGGYASTLTAHLSLALSRRKMGVVLPVDPLDELPNRCLNGVVAMTFDQQFRALLAGLEHRTHIVYLDKFDATRNEYAVCSDHLNSGQLAARHFITRGGKRLGFLGGNRRSFLERLAGYRKAISEAGVPVDERLFVLADSGTSHIAAITRLVRDGADCLYVPGASFQAIECLHFLTYVMNLSVPKDISIIGGENDGISAIQNPPLTTIREPLREMADHAVAILHQLNAGEPVIKRHTIFPVTLIERNSVA